MVGHTEIMIIAGVVLVLFGSTAIPKFFKALGNARNEFEKGSAEASAPKSLTDDKKEPASAE